jgi:hypothetical protein
MKKYILLIITAMLFFGSCKTSRFFSKRNEKAIVETNIDVTESSAAKIDVKTLETIAENVEVQEDVTETTIVVKWSEPDTMGQQFPVETTTKIRTSAKNQKTGILTEKTQDVKAETTAAKVDKSTENSDINIQTAEKTEVKKSTPGWVMLVAVILSLWVVIFTYLILKKYKVL